MSTPDSDSLQASMTAQVWGDQEARIRERLQALDPDLARMIEAFAYGEVYPRAGLDLKTKELLACAMLLTLGSPPELTTHLRGALRAGASETELREALLFAVPYVGFPRVVSAFAQLERLLAREKTPSGEGAG